MNEATPEAKELLPRNLGLWGIWLLVINGFIGSGIFGLPAGATRLAGAWSPLIYIACALLILPIVLCFSEAASYYRGTGGPIRYATDTYGRFIGFQTGWLYYIARVVAFSAGSVLLVDSISYFWPEANQGHWRWILLAIICFGMTAINVIGNVRAIRSLGVFTVLKFIALLGLVILGVFMLELPGIEAMQQSAISTDLASLDLGGAILLLMYAYVGFESATVPAGEARNPARDMPRALLLGTLVAGLLYLCIQLVSMAALPDLADTSTPLLDVAAVLFGETGAVLLMAGLVASVGGNLLGAIFSSPRMSYALGLDGSLPAWFAVVHPRFLTPANSIVFFGVVSFLLAAFGSFIWLAAISVLARLFVYIVTCSAVPVLRRQHEGAAAFRMKGGLLVPALGILGCLGLLVQVSRDSLLVTLMFAIFGTLLYWLAQRANKV
ncbi:MAG: APC family permease [Gammaproteobacteria bacterium]|nr:APC family permease [Gammaproteobacteria bacterium]